MGAGVSAEKHLKREYDLRVTRLKELRAKFSTALPDEPLLHRDATLTAVASAGALLFMASAKWRADRAIVLAAVASDGLALAAASPELQDDAELVLVACQQNWRALEYASRRCCDDAELVAKIVVDWPAALRYASLRVRGLSQVVVLAFKGAASSLEWAAPELLDSADFVEAALAAEVGADALGHCSDAIRANPEVVRLVCGQNCNGLRWAHPSLQANRSLVLECVSTQGRSLEWASVDLRRDHEIVLAAVTQDANALQFAHEKLRANPKIVLQAARSNPAALQFLAESASSNLALMTACDKVVGQGGLALRHASPALRRHARFMLGAICRDPRAVGAASLDLLADVNFMTDACTIDGFCLASADRSLRSHPEVVLAAVGQSGEALQFSDPILQADRPIVLRAVQTTGTALEFASQSLQDDYELVVEAIASGGSDAVQFASERLRSYGAQVLKAKVQADVEQATTFMQEVLLGALGPPGCGPYWFFEQEQRQLDRMYGTHNSRCGTPGKGSKNSGSRNSTSGATTPGSQPSWAAARRAIRKKQDSTRVSPFAARRATLTPSRRAKLSASASIAASSGAASVKSNSVLATPQRHIEFRNDGRGGGDDGEEPLSPLMFSGQLTGAGVAWNGDSGGGGGDRGQWKEPTTPLVKAAAVALGQAGTLSISSSGHHNNGSNSRGNGTVSRGLNGGGGLSSGSATYRQLASASSALTHSSRLNSRQASRRVSTVSSAPSWQVRPCTLRSLLKGGPPLPPFSELPFPEASTTATALAVEGAAADGAAEVGAAAAAPNLRDLVLQGGTYVGGSAGPWGAKLKQLIADFAGAKYGRAFEVCKTAHQRLVAAFPNTTTNSDSATSDASPDNAAPIPAPAVPLCLPWESPTFGPPVVVHTRPHQMTVGPEEDNDLEEDLDALEEQLRQKEALAARKKLARRARRRVFWVMDAPNRAQDRLERRANRAIVSNALATQRANLVLKEANILLQEHACMVYEDALSREAAIKAAAAAAGMGKVTKVVQGPSAAAQMLVLGGRGGGKNSNKKHPHASSNKLSRENSQRWSSSRPGSPNTDNRSSSTSLARTPDQIRGPENSDVEDHDNSAENLQFSGVGGYVDSDGKYHSDSSSGDSDDYSYETESLPEGWHEAFDERSFAPYWFHASTGESTWERPLSPDRDQRRRRRRRRSPPPDPSLTVSYVLPSICFEPWPMEEKSTDSRTPRQLMPVSGDQTA